MLGKMCRNGHSHTALAGMKNGTVALEDTLGFLQNATCVYRVTHNCAPWHLHEGVEDLRPRTNLHVDAYSSFLAS